MGCHTRLRSRGLKAWDFLRGKSIRNRDRRMGLRNPTRHELDQIARDRRLVVRVCEPARLQRALAERISTHDVRYDRLTRALYATDASVYQIVPLLVAFPANTEDVVATVEICGRFQVPITARGGGTSQAGQSIGPGVILDCSKHFDRVLEINPAERWVRVEPGCVLDELNRALLPHRLLLRRHLDVESRDDRRHDRE